MCIEQHMKEKELKYIYIYIHIYIQMNCSPIQILHMNDYCFTEHAYLYVLQLSIMRIV